jgi:hypothetical protein
MPATMRLLAAPLLALSVLGYCVSVTATGGDSAHFVIQFAGGADRWCEMAVTTQEGGHSQRAVTRFRSNRLNTEMRYFSAEFDGEIIGVDLAGLHVTEDPVVEDSTGTFRPPHPADPVEKRLTMMRTFALDPRGRVTFFHGVVHAPGANNVLAHIVWGYPPDTAMQHEDAAKMGSKQ